MSEQLSTVQLVKAWEQAQLSAARADRERNQAHCNLENAKSALAKHLAPDDMGAGETIGVWVRMTDETEKLVTVTMERGTLKLGVREKKEKRKPPTF